MVWVDISTAKLPAPPTPIVTHGPPSTLASISHCGESFATRTDSVAFVYAMAVPEDVLAAVTVDLNVKNEPFA
jgi:hypothetical protein